MMLTLPNYPQVNGGRGQNMTKLVAIPVRADTAQR